MKALLWTIRIALWVVSWSFVFLCWIVASLVNHWLGLGLTDNWDMLKLTISMPFYAPSLIAYAGAIEMLMYDRPDQALRLIAYGSILPIVVTFVTWA